MENKERNKIQKECLLQAIDDMGGRSSKLLWVIFIVNFFTLQLYGNNSMSYVFISEVPEFHCSIPELKNANWTTNQINEIAIVDPCTQYKLNYTHLANLGYDNALEFIKESEFLPSVVSCTSFTFNESVHSTIVDEWELVCDQKVHRTYTFLVYSLGIVFGAAIVGICADKYGRKTLLMIGIILQIASGPASALVPWFWTFLLSRYLAGVSTGAMFTTAYTILSEIVKKDKRKVLVAGLDSMLSIGTFFVICMAYILPNWRELQLGISCFLIPVLSLVWLIPESPRWLISQNRYDEAQKIIERYDKSFVEPPTYSIENPTFNFSAPKSLETIKKNKGFFYRNFESLIILFTTSDLRRKILVMFFTFYVTMIVDYILIFSADNFNSDQYIYISIAAINEILANMTILVVMIVLNTKESLIIVYILAFFFMITITAIPTENKNIIIGLALAAKFCNSASFTANLVWNSESFPSNIKSTALGLCIVMGQVGSMTAPFIVDLLGKIALWVPTTIGSILALIAGLLCFIPQTVLDDESELNVDKEV
ncbi:organic cation transporter protein-like isoform X1 [Cotesia glomerata]|uniref:organic cation transporter protein-like isoform X1 n=1 Tax=Cotesia glomerata TaxID=32391 RepID=UPI001D00D794|nr:organic cation transporter protein-like isoform X1 [Cotesia glomerata]